MARQPRPGAPIQDGARSIENVDNIYKERISRRLVSSVAPTTLKAAENAAANNSPIMPPPEIPGASPRASEISVATLRIARAAPPRRRTGLSISADHSHFQASNSTSTGNAKAV